MQWKNVLIIEDHPLIVEGYRSMLSSNYPMQMTSVSNCEETYRLFANGPINKFDIIFLDWILPVFKEQKLYDGGDLIPLIKKHSPNSKLIILTSHTDAITLYQIIKKAEPDALLCKVDFIPADFPYICAILNRDEKYYSRTVQKHIKQITSRTVFLDNYNRQIILLLSKGIKTKNIPQYLSLSISAIDKRKAQIKDYFLLEKGNDEDIIKEAKRRNLI